MSRDAGEPGPRVNLEALQSRLPGPPVTRFAPSPTGVLHLGHLVNAIYVWGIAHALGGRVLLRLENHDRDRSRPEYERAILDDLEWLGFVTDSPAARQMNHPERYRAALARLTDHGLTYWCDCSRRTLRDARAAPEGELRYGGRCRNRGLGPGGERGVRVRIPEGNERFDDARLGVHVQSPAEQCGDLLVRDRHGNWTYQFAVTVDDYVDDVTLVIRGVDLLASTGRQIALARLLGRSTPPLFLHHALVHGPTGHKLSKSDQATGVRELREAGVSADEVIGRAAAAVGLVNRPASISAREVPALFRG